LPLFLLLNLPGLDLLDLLRDGRELGVDPAGETVDVWHNPILLQLVKPGRPVVSTTLLCSSSMSLAQRGSDFCPFAGLRPNWLQGFRSQANWVPARKQTPRFLAFPSQVGEIRHRSLHRASRCLSYFIIAS